MTNLLLGNGLNATTITHLITTILTLTIVGWAIRAAVIVTVGILLYQKIKSKH